MALETLKQHTDVSGCCRRRKRCIGDSIADSTDGTLSSTSGITGLESSTNSKSMQRDDSREESDDEVVPPIVTHKEVPPVVTHEEDGVPPVAAH